VSSYVYATLHSKNNPSAPSSKLELDRLRSDNDLLYMILYIILVREIVSHFVEHKYRDLFRNKKHWSNFFPVIVSKLPAHSSIYDGKLPAHRDCLSLCAQPYLRNCYVHTAYPSELHSE